MTKVAQDTDPAIRQGLLFLHMFTIVDIIESKSLKTNIRRMTKMLTDISGGRLQVWNSQAVLQKAY